MLESYLITLEYFAIGLIGGSGHYLKKRYLDNTTLDSFETYLSANITSTYKAIFAIFCSTTALSIANTTGYILSMPELYGVLTAGYSADSLLNKSSEIKP